MAAVAGDAENINKQARNGRKDWLNSPARVPMRTRQSGRSSKSCDTSESVFPKTFRELATVPGVTPSIHYHSLVVERDQGHSRYREFVFFRAAEYVRPVYLLA